MFEEIKLKHKQKSINKKYEKEGLTDEVLTEQMKLNKIKHESDISDSSKKVYDNYVQ